MKEMKRLLKFGIILFCAVFFFGCVAEIRMAPRPEEPAPPPAAGIRPWDLKVLQLRMSPDPIQEGQRVSFQAVVSNLSQYSGRASFFIKDRDEIITQVYDVFLRPGENRVISLNPITNSPEMSIASPWRWILNGREGRLMSPDNFVPAELIRGGRWHPLA